MPSLDPCLHAHERSPTTWSPPLPPGRSPHLRLALRQARGHQQQQRPLRPQARHKAVSVEASAPKRATTNSTTAEPGTNRPAEVQCHRANWEALGQCKGDPSGDLDAGTPQAPSRSASPLRHRAKWGALG